MLSRPFVAGRMRTLFVPHFLRRRVSVVSTKSLKISALSNWAGMVANIAIAFLLTPVVAGYLGTDRFGLWLLASSLVGYFGFLELGLGNGLLRYIPLYRSRQENERIAEAFSTALAFYLGAGLLVLSVSLLFSSAVAHFFNTDGEFTALVRLVGLSAAIQFPTLMLNAAIKSYEGWLYSNISGVVSSLVRAGLLFLSVWMGCDLATMGWALVVSNSVGLLLAWYFFRKCCVPSKLSLKLFRLKELKLLVSFGAIMIVCTLAELLIFESPKVLAGKLLSLETVAYFGIAATMAGYYRQAIITLSQVCMPRFSFLSNQEGLKAAKDLFLRGSGYSAIFSAGFAVSMWCIGPSFIPKWMGTSFAAATPALLWLTCGALVVTSHSMSVHLLYGLGLQKWVGALEILEGVGVFASCLCLVPGYKLVGLAMGASLPVILVRTIAQGLVVKKVLGLSVTGFYYERVLKAWAVAGVLTALFYVLGASRWLSGWPSLIICGVVLSSAYGAGAWLCCRKSIISNEL